MMLQRFFHRLARPEFIALVCYSCFLHYFLFRAGGSHFVVLLPPVCGRPGVERALPAPLSSRVAALGVIGGLLIPVPASFAAIKGAFWDVFHPLRHRDLIAAVRVVDGAEPALATGDSAFLLSASLPLNGPFNHLYGDEDELRAARFLASNMGPGEALYVGVSDHTPDRHERRARLLGPWRPGRSEGLLVRGRPDDRGGYPGANHNGYRDQPSELAATRGSAGFRSR